MSQRRSREIPPHLLDDLRDAVASALGARPDFASAWQSVVTSFLQWLNGLPADVSPLVRNLELLRRVEQAFNAPNLKTNTSVARIILSSGVTTEGTVTIHGQTWRVVSCAISPRFGVDYTLTNEKGELLRHEFFD